MGKASRLLTPVAVLAVLAVLALDYAALDDITTGREPGFVLEGVFLAVSVPLLALLGRTIRRDWRRRPG